MQPFSVEAALVAWVRSMGYPCAQLMQHGRAGVFVTVERVGGSVDDFVQRASVALQVWADSNAEADAVANALVLALLTQQPPAGIHSVTVTDGPYFWPDYETSRARYQLVCDVYAQIDI